MALKFAREDPKTFLQYNQHQLSRIYPAGSRIDSSNYDPMMLWAIGCQLGTFFVVVFLVFLTCMLNSRFLFINILKSCFLICLRRFLTQL